MKKTPTLLVIIIGVILIFIGTKLLNHCAPQSTWDGYFLYETTTNNVSANLNQLSEEITSNNKEINALRGQVESISQEIFNIKNTLIERTGGLDDLGLPLGKANEDIASTYFLVEENGKNGQKLKESLKNLQNEFIRLNGSKQGLYIDNYGFYEDPFDPKIKVTWEQSNSELLPLAVFLGNLSLIELKMYQNLATVSVKHGLK